MSGSLSRLRVLAARYHGCTPFEVQLVPVPRMGATGMLSLRGCYVVTYADDAEGIAEALAWYERASAPPPPPKLALRGMPLSGRYDPRDDPDVIGGWTPERGWWDR